MTIQCQRCIKFRVLRAQDFYTPLALNYQKGQHLPAPDVYKNQSPIKESLPGAKLLPLQFPELSLPLVKEYPFCLIRTLSDQGSESELGRVGALGLHFYLEREKKVTFVVSPRVTPTMTQNRYLNLKKSLLNRIWVRASHFLAAKKNK